MNKTCSLCKYIAPDMKGFRRHLKSQKHQKNAEKINQEVEERPKEERTQEKKTKREFYLPDDIIKAIRDTNHYKESSIKKMDYIIKNLYKNIFPDGENFTLELLEKNIPEVVKLIKSKENIHTQKDYIQTVNGIYHLFKDKNPMVRDMFYKDIDEIRDKAQYERNKPNKEITEEEIETRKQQLTIFDSLEDKAKELRDIFLEKQDYDSALNYRLISLYTFGNPALRPSDYLNCVIDPKEAGINSFIDLDKGKIYIQGGKSGGAMRNRDLPQLLIEVIKETNPVLKSIYLLPKKNLQEPINSTNSHFNKIFKDENVKFTANTARNIYDSKLKDKYENNQIDINQLKEEEQYLNHNLRTSQVDYSKFQSSTLQNRKVRMNQFINEEDENLLPTAFESDDDEETTKVYSYDDVEIILDELDEVKEENEKLHLELKKLKKFILDKVLSGQSIDFQFC